MIPFTMDGEAYNVRVSELTRKFSVQDTDNAGRTQNGDMYREIIGTFYNYSMTVEQMGDDRAAMDRFWEAISQPVKSHVCVFPYNQKTITQRMYITGGQQQLIDMNSKRKRWGPIQVSCIAMTAKVKP